MAEVKQKAFMKRKHRKRSRALEKSQSANFQQSNVAEIPEYNQTQFYNVGDSLDLRNQKDEGSQKHKELRDLKKDRHKSQKKRKGRASDTDYRIRGGIVDDGYHQRSDDQKVDGNIDDRVDRLVIRVQHGRRQLSLDCDEKRVHESQILDHKRDHFDDHSLVDSDHSHESDRRSLGRNSRSADRNKEPEHHHGVSESQARQRRVEYDDRREIPVNHQTGRGRWETKSNDQRRDSSRRRDSSPDHRDDDHSRKGASFDHQNDSHVRDRSFGSRRVQDARKDRQVDETVRSRDHAFEQRSTKNETACRKEPGDRTFDKQRVSSGNQWSHLTGSFEAPNRGDEYHDSRTVRNVTEELPGTQNSYSYSPNITYNPNISKENDFFVKCSGAQSTPISYNPNSLGFQQSPGNYSNQVSYKPPEPLHMQYHNTELVSYPVYAPQVPQGNFNMADEFLRLKNECSHLHRENERLKSALVGIICTPDDLEPEVKVVFKHEELVSRFKPEIENFVTELFAREGLQIADLFSEKALFTTDETGASLDDSRSSAPPPIYQVDMNVSIGDENEDVPPSSESFRNVCFNCCGDHLLADCPQTLCYKTIAENRAERLANMAPQIRYHVQENSIKNFKPGVISDKLREALQLQPNQVPSYIYHMRILGYPPGWLEEATVKSSGLSLYGTKEHETEENGNPENKDKIHYDSEKLIDYPGFNVPLPPDIIDESQELGFPPLQVTQLRSFMENSFEKPDVRPKRKRELETMAQERPLKLPRLEEDMEVVDECSGEIVTCPEVCLSPEFIPPLPEDNNASEEVPRPPSSPPPPLGPMSPVPFQVLPPLPPDSPAGEMPPPPPPPPPPPAEDSDCGYGGVSLCSKPLTSHKEVFEDSPRSPSPDAYIVAQDNPPCIVVQEDSPLPDTPLSPSPEPLEGITTEILSPGSPPLPVPADEIEMPADQDSVNAVSSLNNAHAPANSHCSTPRSDTDLPLAEKVDVRGFLDSPSLTELEEQKRRIMLELGVAAADDNIITKSEELDVSISESSAVHMVMPDNELYVCVDAGSEEPGSSIAGEKPAVSDLSDYNESNVDSVSGVDVISQSSQNSFLHESEDSFHGDSAAESVSSSQRSFSSTSLSFGSPAVPVFTSVRKLPKFDKFSEGIQEHLPFENLPNSTGGYEQIKGVLKKIRDQMSHL